jgi:hypothetical protein
MQQAQQQSPLVCSFPAWEVRCNPKEQDVSMTRKTTMMTPKTNISNPLNQQDQCALVKESLGHLAKYQASAMEYLFQQVSFLVIQE